MRRQNGLLFPTCCDLLTKRYVYRCLNVCISDAFKQQWIVVCWLFVVCCNLLLGTLYSYICILLLYKSTVPLSISPRKLHIRSKVCIIYMKSRYPPEPVFVLRLLPGGAASSPNVMFSTVSTPGCQMGLQKQMNVDRQFLYFP